MARITVEDCLVHENNRFALVQLASRRTKQLLRGATPHLDEIRNKAVVNSLREIAAGDVRFMTEEEVETHRLELERKRIEDAERAAVSASERSLSPVTNPEAGLALNGDGILHETSN